MDLSNNCIKNLFDIKDPNLEIIDIDTSCPNTTICTFKLEYDNCHNCGGNDFVFNGFKTVEVPYITANATHHVTFKIKKHGFFCNNCQQYFLPTTTLVNKFCHISNAIKRKILSALTEDRSMTSIARENNVSVNTVQRILDNCSSDFITSNDTLPEHLAFDEFRGVGKKLHFICLDSNKHTVVTILADRYKKSINKYFESFPFSDRKKVKTVSMDLNCYYGELARKLFPNAKIIIDRFHLIQMITRSFNSYRVLTMKKIDKDKNDPERSVKHRIYKKYWKLFLKKYKELEGTKTFSDPYLRYQYTPAQVVDKGLQYDAPLRASYDFMQDFMTALSEKDSQKLEELLNSNINEYCSQLQTTIRTFRKNRAAVLNAATSSYSNGCLEGFNRKIKQIQRTAFGYRDLTNMLKRIRLEQRNVPIKKESSIIIA